MSKILGVILDQHFLWEEHVNNITSSCFGALAIVKKFKNIMTLKLKKQFAELLILSKMDYADVVFHPLSLKLQKRLQKVENAAASLQLPIYYKGDITSLLKMVIPLQKLQAYYHLTGYNQNLRKNIFRSNCSLDGKYLGSLSLCVLQRL